MPKKNKIIILAATFFILTGSVQAASWMDVSGSGGKNGLISSRKGAETNIAVSESGEIYAAFQDKRDRVFVREFDGSKWIDFPGDSKNNYLARNGDKPAMAARGNDLYLAYKDLDAGRRARVKKWNGASWSDLADANHSLGFISSLEGFEPALCFDKSGENLYAAFRDEVSGQRIKAMKWSDSSGWQAMADGNNPDGLVSNSVASEVDIKASKLNDDMYIAYEDIANGGRIRVRKWDGANWQDLSDSNHSGGIASSIAGYSPSIDLDNFGNLYLVYTGKNANNTYIHKWDGNNWNNIGDGVAVRGKTIESIITTDSRGYLYLAYSQKTKGAWHVRAKVWNSSRWLDARDGKSENISRGKGKGDPSLATFENRLYMSFTDARNKNRARVKMLNFAP